MSLKKINKSPSSYNQILRASAIVGGAQAIDLIIRMIRTKFVALLLGPSGVGLLGLYQSIIEWIGTVSGLGLRSSAVRRIADSHGKGNVNYLARTVKVLRRICWISGLCGWLLTAILARPICLWILGSSERVWAVSILGITLLVESISAGQTALLQGVRRIGDMARVMILSSIGGAIISVGLYAWLGEQGIVPAIVTSAIVNLAFSWWFSNRVTASLVEVGWQDTIREARHLIYLGLAFMWAGVLTAGVTFATRGLIIRGFGIDASGIYQAAWGISGLFAGFVLTAMGQDFYPRLTAAANDNTILNQLVNEQTEIGMLIALPGLLTTLAFSPLVIQIFYTTKFISAAEMLPWFIVGVFLRVIAWPLGFIQLAKGASMIFAISETVFNSLHLLFIWVGLRYLGLVGVAIAFMVVYICYCSIALFFAIRLSGFRWTIPVVRLIGFSTLFIIAELCIMKIFASIYSVITSALLILFSGTFCLRQLIYRIGPNHRISIAITNIPWIGHYFQVK